MVEDGRPCSAKERVGNVLVLAADFCGVLLIALRRAAEDGQIGIEESMESRIDPGWIVGLRRQDETLDDADRLRRESQLGQCLAGQDRALLLVGGSAVNRVVEPDRGEHRLIRVRQKVQHFLEMAERVVVPVLLAVARRQVVPPALGHRNVGAMSEGEPEESVAHRKLEARRERGCSRPRMIRTLFALTLVVSLAGSASAQQTQAGGNALASATSRFLRDASASHINWRPWGQTAIDAAARANRPLFVSIGFASSWDAFRLHREAFANSVVADTLNGYFVPVLVDSIENPEVAEAFEAIQRAVGGTVTTPASFVLTPALEPVAAIGFTTPVELRTWLATSASRWANERDAFVAEGRKNLIKAHSFGDKRAPSDYDATTLDAVMEDIARTHDAKVLQPMAISFALRYAERTGNKAVRAAALESLRTFARTAMRDQIGGGFHRAPGVFEKILSAQALMAMTYLEAWQLTKEPQFEMVVRTTLDYIIRDQQRTKGAFVAAQDAHGLVPGQGPEFHNGTFYLWSKSEIVKLLGPEAAAKALRAYGIESETGNLPVSVEPLDAEIAQKLLDHRQKRPEPFRDFNELSGWNGLMISALSRAGAAFGDRKYIDAALLATRSITTKLWDEKKKTLYRSDAATVPVIPALSDDYAMLIQGLLDLFDATSDVKWLELAKTLQARQDQLFWDASAGRYTTGTALPEVLRGLLVESDATVPSVNALAASNQLRLAMLTGSSSARVPMIVSSFAGRLRRSGAELPQLASSLAMTFETPKIEVVVAGKKTETLELLRSIYARWEPMRTVILLQRKGAERDRITRVLPFTAALAPEPELPVAYVCEKGECRRQ